MNDLKEAGACGGDVCVNWGEEGHVLKMDSTQYNIPTNEVMQKYYMEVSCSDSNSEAAGDCPLSCIFFKLLIGLFNGSSKGWLFTQFIVHI